MHSLSKRTPRLRFVAARQVRMASMRPPSASSPPTRTRQSPAKPVIHASPQGVRGLAIAASAFPVKKPMFSKILIANRGEIACRIIRTCRELGVLTVAVFSEPDRHSQHVLLADEAYCIGPAPSTESYLNVEKILEVVARSGAQAVHPGYGFLSENATFAERLEEEGIVFIGPPPSAIVSMGSKSESKDIMIKAGVPCIPGWHPSSSTSPSAQEPSSLLAEADKIGYPVLIKAVSGGGGKGMKIVSRREEFLQQLESAKREASKGFNDDTVLLEKYLPTSRHVEVQIFSDSQGNHVSLFERDCSVQRRHQKVIEEAPAPGLSPELRERLYDCARKAAAAVGYRGAGTVEFIMDADNNNNFYFLEMNVRLQVEHPVTEAITGVDLVEWQLEVAAGNPIPLSQSDLTCTGHAFECRIYAENPSNNFLPDTGLLSHVRPPPPGAGVRLETGFITGDEISVFYDPLIAKLIVHGSDRTEALRLLRKALAEYQVVGPHTNIPFLKRLAAHSAFIDGEVETAFIPKHFDDLFAPPEEPSASALAQAGVFLALRDLSISTLNSKGPWSSSSLSGYRVGSTPASRTITLHETSEPESRSASITVAPSRDAFGALSVSVVDFDGATVEFGTSVPPLIGDTLGTVDVVQQGTRFHLFDSPRGFAGEVERRQPAWVDAVLGKKDEVKGSARAPMPSRIVQVFVKAGDTVEQGAPLVMVEAMKTEHVLRAPKAGVVKLVVAEVGELVPEGKILVTFEEEATVE